MGIFREPINAVTVCHHYGDFFKIAAAYNHNLFDRWVVVTGKDDLETQEVCRQQRLTCVISEDHNRDGGFSKGRMIERGLQHLPADGWILHIDADIVLPQSFRRDLERSHLEPDCIYGWDRIMLKSWDDWKKLEASGWIQNTSGWWHPHGVEFPSGYQVGARWAGGDGWVPIGFACFWHRKGSGEEWRGARMGAYPQGHSDSTREDVQKGLQFDRRKRVFIPEIICAHLESDIKSKVGANWKGRTTPWFGPPEKEPKGNDEKKAK